MVEREKPISRRKNTDQNCADCRALPIRKAFKTNVLEDDGDEIDMLVSLKAGIRIANVELVIKPFEVVTLRLEI
jgi:hypothetical protein